MWVSGKRWKELENEVGRLERERCRTVDSISILEHRADGASDRIEDLETEIALARTDAVLAKGLTNTLDGKVDQAEKRLDVHNDDIEELIEKHNIMASSLIAAEKQANIVGEQVAKLRGQVQCGITGHKWSEGLLTECPAMRGAPGDHKYNFICGKCGAIYKKAESDLNPFERKLAGLDAIIPGPKGTVGDIRGGPTATDAWNDSKRKSNKSKEKKR